MKKIIPLLLLLMAGAGLYAQQTDHPKFRFQVNGGLAHMLYTDAGMDKLKLIGDDAYDSYMRRIKWVWNGEANAYVMLRRNFGLGLKGRVIRWGTPQTDLLFDLDEYHYGVMSVAESNQVYFGGPTALYAAELGSLEMTASLTAGYAHLFSSVTVLEKKVDMDGGNIGFQGDLSLEYRVTANLSVGFNTGYMFARITKVNTPFSEKKQSLNTDEIPDLSNLKLNASVTFLF